MYYGHSFEDILTSGIYISVQIPFLAKIKMRTTYFQKFKLFQKMGFYADNNLKVKF